MDSLSLFSITSVTFVIFAKYSNLNTSSSSNGSSSETDQHSSYMISNISTPPLAPLPSKWVAPTEPYCSVEEAVAALERRVQLDEGGRGIEDIVSEGELLAAADSLLDEKVRNVVVLTGFPCLLEHNPPTETDGPSGALAIIRALLYLGKQVQLLTDQCNEEVLLMATAASQLPRIYGSSKLVLESFPPVYSFDASDGARLRTIADWADAVVAIERPGPNSAGDYVTMTGRVMNHLVAPLDDVITYRMGMIGTVLETPVGGTHSGETGEESEEEDERKREASESIDEVNLKPFLSVGIGDGGNEVGMGKWYSRITASSRIPRAAEIACVVPCTHTLVCSVSNWGGYALAAALALRSCSAGGAMKADQSMLVSNGVETAIVREMVTCGARDGVTGQQTLSVDGMTLETSLAVLSDLNTIICNKIYNHAYYY